MKVDLQLEGIQPLLMHNERLADPLDSFTKALSEITGKRKKSEADHLEIARLEFFGGLYTDPPLELDSDGELTDGKAKVCLPTWNIIRCLQDGAKYQKRGKDVLRGVIPTGTTALLAYDGPASPEKLWLDKRFSVRKAIGVQKNRTMRTRPKFEDWSVAVQVEVDPNVFDLHTVNRAMQDAGRYCGIGDMRPVCGRFNGRAVSAEKGASK